MIVTQKLSLDDSIMQNPGLIASNMDGEKVMLSIENGKYYNLGEMGGKIWDLIIRPIKINQIVASLMEDFEVDQEICVKEVIAFLESLCREKIIRVNEA